MALAGLTATALAAVVLADLADLDVQRWSTGAAVAAGLAGAVAVLALLRWRTLGDASSALVGIAFGGLVLAVVPPGAAGGSGATEVGLDVTRLAVLVAVIVLCAVAGRTAQVDTGLRIGWWLGATALGVAVLALAGSLVIGDDPLSTTAVAVTHAVVAVGLVATAVHVRSRLIRRTASAGWLAPTLVGLAVAEAFRVIAVLTAPVWLLGAQVAVIGALLFAVLGGARDLDAAYREQRARLFGSVVDRGVDSARRAADDLLAAGRRHDAKSSITAIDGATTVLGRYAHDLDPAQRTRLHDAVADQIGRLQRLLDVTDDAGADLPLAATLDGLLREPRLRGVTVAVDIPPDLVVHGRIADTVAVVHTLVDRCATPDGTGEPGEVTATARVVDGHVHLRIEAARAPSSPGGAPDHGLDVVIGTQLMAGQGGRLVVLDPGALRGGHARRPPGRDGVSTPPPPRLLIVEDHDLLAQSVALAVTAEGMIGAECSTQRAPGSRTWCCSTWTSARASAGGRCSCRRSASSAPPCWSSPASTTST